MENPNLAQIIICLLFTHTRRTCVLTGICSFANAFLTDINKSTILHIHNSLRRSFANGAQGVIVANMNKLIWSDELERRASRAVRCGRPLPKSKGFSELNMNIKHNSNGNFSDNVLSWYNELDQYLFSPEDGSCWPSYRLCLSAYTLLNAKHRSIGCEYRQNCPESGPESGNAFVCLYDGSGIPFYKPGPVCTKCEEDNSFCDNGLCVSCNPDYEQCDCRKTCNVADIGLGVLNLTTCTCKCQYGMGPNCDEPCDNPEQFEDYDICGEISPEMCDHPEYEDMFIEFCPSLCSCKKFPK